MKIKENMRYSTYAEREEQEDNEFIRDEEMMMDLSRGIFEGQSDDDFEDGLMQNTDEVITCRQQPPTICCG